MSQLARAILLIAVLTAPVITTAAPQKITLTIPTMDCATCPITIKAALMRTPGVISAKVSYAKREAVIVFDDATATVDAMKKATTEAGYPSFVKSSPN
jgi:mercuric ion binding protein